jgi:GGDEF domain-containing protein
VTLARLGGDEFGVLAENCQQVGQAGKLAQCIIERMREPFQFDGTACSSVPASASACSPAMR